MNTVSAAPPSAPTGRSFRQVWLITGGHALTHWYPGTFYLLLPLIGKEFGLSYTQIGLVMTSQYLAGAIANIPGGMLVDNVGRKGFLMALSLFWIGFPYLLISFTDNYWMVLICVAMVGVGNNLWHPTAIPTLGKLYPERKGLVLSLHGMGGNVGEALAPLAIGTLLAFLTWRDIVVLNVVPGVVMAVMILLFLGALRFSSTKNSAGKESLDDDGDHERRTLRQYFGDFGALLRNRALILLCTGSAFRSMTQNALLTFLPVFLAYEMGYSPFWVGVSMFALQTAGFIASPISGHLSDRLGRRQILVSTMAMTAVVLAFMAFAGRSPAFVFFVAALGFFLYAIRPVLQAWLLEATPKNMGGTSIGMLFGIQALGSAAAPAIGGLIADAYGLQTTFYFLAATIVIANVFVFFVPVGAAREAAAPGPAR